MPGHAGRVTRAWLAAAATCSPELFRHHREVGQTTPTQANGRGRLRSAPAKPRAKAQVPVTRFQPRSSRSRRRARRDPGPCLPLPARRARSSEALRNGRAVLGDGRVQWSLQRVRVSIPRRVTCRLFGDHSNFVGRGRRPCRRGCGVFRAGAATGPGANPGGQGANRPSTAEGPSLTLARARASRNASRAPPVGAPSVGHPLPSPATPEFAARQHPSGDRALIYDISHPRSKRAAESPCTPRRRWTSSLRSEPL